MPLRARLVVEQVTDNRAGFKYAQLTVQPDHTIPEGQRLQVSTPTNPEGSIHLKIDTPEAIALFTNNAIVYIEFSAPLAQAIIDPGHQSTLAADDAKPVED